MSPGGSERESPGGTTPDALNEVVAELRTELQSIRERELRRESRLVTFDQQIAQMEASLEKEVERLRSTGAAVDLITEHLRIAVRELLGEREQMAGDLDDLRGRIEALGAPDLQPVLTQLDQLSNRVASLAGRELRPLADQLEALRHEVGARPSPDLEPVTRQLAALDERVSAIPIVDVEPISSMLVGLGRQLRDSPRRSPPTSNPCSIGSRHRPPSTSHRSKRS